MGEAEFDERFVWFEERICVSYDIPSATFQLTLKIDDNKIAIMNFLDQPNVRRLLFYMDPRAPKNQPPPTKGSKTIAPIVASADFPRLRLDNPKVVVFVKLVSGRVSLRTAGRDVLFFETSLSAPNFAHAMLTGVFLPIVGTPGVVSGLPSSLVSELTLKTQIFASQTEALRGVLQNKTILPLPVPTRVLGGLNKPSVSTLSRQESVTALYSKDEIRSFEVAVSGWSRQAKRLIATKPESAFARAVAAAVGAAPGGRGAARKEFFGPDEEIDFWDVRVADLASVRSQLLSNRFIHVRETLRRAKSKFHSSFERIVSDVEVALEEAEDVALHLSTLKPVMALLRESLNDFAANAATIQRFFRVLHLIWEHCHFYNAAEHIARMLQALSNFVIYAATKHIQPDVRFDPFAFETPFRCAEVLRICDIVRICYLKFALKEFDLTRAGLRPLIAARLRRGRRGTRLPGCSTLRPYFEISKRLLTGSLSFAFSPMRRRRFRSLIALKWGVTKGAL